MTLEEFAENLKNDIDEFVKKWEQGVEETPEVFPEKLTLDEWYTQYTEFQFTSRIKCVIMITSNQEGQKND